MKITIIFAVMEDIPFFNIERQTGSLKNEILRAFSNEIDRCDFTNGDSVKSFEKSFSRYCETDYCTALNSGTSALQLALIALDVKSGDEVLLPANTFIATVWACLYLKAIPVFVDCDTDTWQIDFHDLERKITKETKAIIGVHLYGQPFDFDEVNRIATQYNIPIVEDAAQAHGALYKGKKVGGLGDIACFSFYPTKNLGTYGEGGAIVTNNRDYYERIQALRNNASKVKYSHEELGYNMRMGSLEAIVLNEKFKYLDEWNFKRIAIANRYQKEIDNPKIKCQANLLDAEGVYHLFVVTVDDRNRFVSYLENLKIKTGIHYPIPCHLQKAVTELNLSNTSLKNVEFLSKHCVSLPMFPELYDEEIQRVIDAVNAY